MMHPDEYQIGATLLVAGVGLVAGVAFVSLLVQVRALFGGRGISPVAEQADELRAAGVGWRRAPSVFWWRADDRTLLAVGTVGLLAAALLAVQPLVADAPANAVALAALVAWGCYLSFTTLGARFLSYQWDVLLLETFLVAAVIALALPARPYAIVVAWVLFIRFMIASGVAKLASGDRTWRELTTLDHHFETQPLPTRTAWHAHHLPRPLRRGGTLAVLVTEIAAPLLLLGPPRVQLAAVAVLALLQIAIASTGNYGFFNLLTLVLLLPFVHDRFWYALFGWDHPPTRILAIPPPPHPVIEGLVLGGVVLLLVANVARLLTLAVEPRPVARLLAALRPWRIANRYGLFAVMTTTRPEITLEWSDEGKDWAPYVLRWKPGPLDRAPRWNQPHQPRLDWQMWFAALGSPAANPWLVDLCARLLEAEPAVLRLFAEAPDHPPRLVRARLDAYRYTDRSTRRHEGRWWATEPLGAYLPALTLHGGRVTRAEGVT